MGVSVRSVPRLPSPRGRGACQVFLSRNQSVLMELTLQVGNEDCWASGFQDREWRQGGPGCWPGQGSIPGKPLPRRPAESGPCPFSHSVSATRLPLVPEKCQVLSGLRAFAYALATSSPSSVTPPSSFQVFSSQLTPHCLGGL